MARGITNGTGSEGVFASEVGSVGVDNFTLGFWFHASNSSAISKCYHGHAGATGLGLHVNNTASKLDVLMGGKGWFIGGSFTTGQWNHGLLTRSGGTAQVYLNGSALGTTTTTAPNALAGTGDFLCGQMFGTGTTMLAEWFLYNRVLTAAEITLLSQGYAPSFIQSGLVSYLPGTGQNSPEPNQAPGGASLVGTVTGATQFPHPSFMRYPRQGLGRLRPRPFAPGLAR